MSSEYQARPTSNVSQPGLTEGRAAVRANHRFQTRSPKRMISAPRNAHSAGSAGDDILRPEGRLRSGPSLPLPKRDPFQPPYWDQESWGLGGKAPKKAPQENLPLSFVAARNAPLTEGFADA